MQMLEPACGLESALVSSSINTVCLSSCNMTPLMNSLVSLFCSAVDNRQAIRAKQWPPKNFCPSCRSAVAADANMSACCAAHCSRRVRCTYSPRSAAVAFLGTVHWTIILTRNVNGLTHNKPYCITANSSARACSAVKKKEKSMPLGIIIAASA